MHIEGKNVCIYFYKSSWTDFFIFYFLRNGCIYSYKKSKKKAHLTLGLRRAVFSERLNAPPLFCKPQSKNESCFIVFYADPASRRLALVESD